MNTSGVENVLVQAMKNLFAEWQIAKTDWHDVKSQQFERDYLETLPQQLARTAGVIAEVNALLKKVRSDCG